MTGKYTELAPEFVEQLNDLEDFLGKPIIVTSGYRNPDHNTTVGGVSKSAHTEQPCWAADIACPDSATRYKIVDFAFRRNIKRIGIGRDFVHLDRSHNLPEYTIWTYYEVKK